MTKSDITEQIYSRIGGSKKESVELLETVFSVMNTLSPQTGSKRNQTAC